MRASLATDTVSIMDAIGAYDCACSECIVKPALVAQVHAQLTYAFMHLARLVFTVLSPLCHELCGNRAFMRFSFAYSVLYFHHGQLETLTAKTQHAIALALTVGFVIGGSIARLLI